MREIEFRGKQITTGEWLYGDIRHHKDDVCIFMQGSNKGEIVKQETVGQYTGLKDMNGKKIYEGDILRWEYEDYDSDTGWHGRVKKKCAVTFEYGSFIIPAYPYYIGGCLDFDEQNSAFEVIGNIYDNFELLKEK